jgi:hypothetical protein
MSGLGYADLIDAVLSCGVILLAGVTAVGVLSVILYPVFGWYSIGIGVLPGFPCGVVIGIWLLSFAAKRVRGR